MQVHGVRANLRANTKVRYSVATKLKKLMAGGAMLAAGLLIAGCSTSGAAAEGDSSGSGGEQVADVAAAQAFLAPFTERPTELLINDPLSAPIPAGATVAFLDLGTPVTALMYESLLVAAEAAGVNVQRVQMSPDPQSISSAMDSIVESKPDVVLSMAVNPDFFSTQLEALRAAGIPVASAGITNNESYDLSTLTSGDDYYGEIGRALASSAVVSTDGTAQEFVMYSVPEMAFSVPMVAGAEAQLAELCAECTLRVVEIPIAQIGSGAGADTIVSDLQANPSTDYFITVVDEVQAGLRAKLDLAGIDTRGVGQAPTPANLEAIAAGQQDATVAVDLNLLVWSLLDQGLRLMVGDPVEYPEPAVMAPTLNHLITEDNAPADPSLGYVAIDDYQQVFTDLWTTNG